MKFIRKLTKNSNYTIQVRTNTPSDGLLIPIYYVICVSSYIIISIITKILEMSNNSTCGKINTPIIDITHTTNCHSKINTRMDKKSRT